MPSTETTVRVFTRTWWKDNPDWPNGLEPCPGHKSFRGHPQGVTEAEARAYCRSWNLENPPGRYSRKAEYTSA